MSLSLRAEPSPADAAALQAPCSLLRMAVSQEVLALPIDDVREILQVTRMTPLPRTPGFVRGVMNLRGAVVPVIDLAVRLGRAPTELGRRSCIVVVDAPRPPQDDDGATPAGCMGLLVDAVFEVFDRNGGEIEPAPALGTTFAPEFLRGMTRSGGQLIGVMALEQVLSPRELTAGIAGHVPH